MRKNDGGPAFAAHAIDKLAGSCIQEGMSLRDWFAGLALQGILSGPCSKSGVPLREWFDAPQQAYNLADAMIKAREYHESP